MKIGAVSYQFINNNIEFNMSQIERAMKLSQGTVDLLCFGETFLQGFDSLNWNYDNDKNIAITVDSDIMQKLCYLTLQYKVDLLLGYIEKSEESLYSSCAVIENGKLIHNYRRISKGWKNYRITNNHYKEGNNTSEFTYRGRPIMVSLCGDIWDFPESFKTDNLLIWPVYVNFSIDEWIKQYEAEYAEQAYHVANHTLMINSISENPDCFGGSYYFVNGKTYKKINCGKEDILIIEI